SINSNTFVAINKRKSHEQFSQSSDLANAYDSAKICCFKESMDDTGPSDGEVGEEEEVEGDLIGITIFNQLLILWVVTPASLSDPSVYHHNHHPTTIPSLSSNIDSPTNTNVVIMIMLSMLRRVTTSVMNCLIYLLSDSVYPIRNFYPKNWNVESGQGQLESPAQHM
ncbi:hypothetical protein EWB00_001150, partial [Schistosoma japonicum]